MKSSRVTGLKIQGAIRTYVAEFLGTVPPVLKREQALVDRVHGIYRNGSSLESLKKAVEDWERTIEESEDSVTSNREMDFVLSLKKLGRQSGQVAFHLKGVLEKWTAQTRYDEKLFDEVLQKQLKLLNDISTNRLEQKLVEDETEPGDQVN